MFKNFIKAGGPVTRAPLFGALALTFLVAGQTARATPTTVDLGAASGFAVLAGSGITVAGAANSTFITGDIGSFPTATMTGLGNVGLTGVNQGGNATTAQAQIDLISAYNTAAGYAPTVIYGGGYDLVGSSLSAGVYNDGSSLFLSGTLTLDGHGDPNAIWIFQTGSTLITASTSKVVLIDGAQAKNVFWVVGSSATLGTDTAFMGNILAWQSITLTTGVTVDGRVLAANGAVTMDANDINILAGNTAAVSVPDGSGTAGLLGLALAALLVGRRHFYPQLEKLPAGFA